MGRNSLLAIFGVLLGGCTIHPLPEDVARDTTVLIVQKIRCEARDAVLAVQKSWSEPYGSYRRDSANFVAAFGATAIGYEFNLDMIEQATSGATLNLDNPFSNGNRRLGVGTALDRKRENTRVFRIADSFAGLLVDLTAEDCRFKSGTRPNFIYPITGTVGLREMIDTFVTLYRDANLAPPTATESPSLADTIEFETVISGSLNPSIQLSKVTHGVGLTDFSIGHAATRKDNHKLFVALSLPRQVATTTTRKRVSTRRNAAVVKGSAEAGAFKAIDSIKNDTFTTTLQRLEQDSNY